MTAAPASAYNQMSMPTRVSTPVSTISRTSFPWFRATLLVVGLLLLGTLATGIWMFRSALPQLDGSVQFTDLKQPVQVKRDARGVPAIQAQNLEDLFFAQGFVTAQDRMWQMDMMRRFAKGELAEVLGADLLPRDREERILGLHLAAEKAAASLSERDRLFFEAYARGVNAYIAQARGHLPVEFKILGYAPKPWAVEDSFAIGASMVQNLNHYPYRAALLREKILAKLGPELTADLFVNSSRLDHPPQTEATAGPDEPAPTDEERDEMEMDEDPVAVLRTSFTVDPRSSQQQEELSAGRAGSNNWVVSGAHTVSGLPLLSNDMHLQHQMPNLWYEAHLTSGNFDVAGVTLPGVPFVVVGHNQRIAWGFTNVGPTAEDVYIETFNDAGKYRTPQGWQDPQKRKELIHVRAGSDIEMEVVTTRHGPIITDLVPGETRKLALRWTLYESFNTPFFDVDSAQNWNELQRAFSAWGAPGQNVVYADTDGHIGYHATGKVPIRATGDGSLPVDGSDDKHEWTGDIPFDKMPSVFDPPSGMLATANGRITPDKYPWSVSVEWDEPWRTTRIYRMLRSGRKFAASDMLALQTDVFSAFDHFCAQRFAEALQRAPNLTPRAQQVRDLLRDWDGRMTKDSAAAVVETRAQRRLIQLLLEPKLGAAGANPAPGDLSWKSYAWSQSSIWLYNILTTQSKRWLPDSYKTYDELLTAAVESTVADAKGDLSQLQWGKESPVRIAHPMYDRIPLLRHWAEPGLHPNAGNGRTVKQAGSFQPSERLTVDLGDLDRTTLNTVTGQSGNLFGANYMDQWQAWYEGQTFPLPFSRTAVDRSTVHRLELQPAE
jgi:penicillin amidase